MEYSHHPFTEPVDLMDTEQRQRTRTLRDLAMFFLRLGTTAFGGPAVYIAMMEQEAVRKRRWLTREAFLDLVGLTNLMPGPNAAQMAMNIGYRQAGWAGLLVGGICFILPASLITLAVAWAYVRFGRLPQVQGFLYGVKPAVLAVVAQALWSLGRTAVKSRLLAAVAVAALLANALGASPLATLLGAGALGLGAAWVREPRNLRGVPAAAWWMGPVFGSAGLPAAGIAGLFLVFLKVGALLYGSGYVLLAFLQADLVHRLHWLTQSQLLDAVAAGQITPGPVFTTATFIGYVLGGYPGATVATVGIFLPSFVYVAVIGRLAERVRGSGWMRVFLDGVNAGAVALMAVLAWQLGWAALVDRWALGLGLVGLALLLRFRLNALWLVVGAGLAGWALTALHP
jgi:chromate transporter